MKWGFQFSFWMVLWVAFTGMSWGQEKEALVVPRTEEGIRESLSKIAKEQQELAVRERAILQQLHERLAASTNRIGSAENPVLVEKRKRLAELQEEMRKLQAEIRDLILQDPALREARAASRLDMAELRELIEKRRALEEQRQILLREKDALIREKRMGEENTEKPVRQETEKEL